MDNCQLPKKPIIEPEDEQKMRELFNIIRLMTSYAGYSEIFKKKQLMIKNDEYNVHRKQNLANHIIETMTKKPDSSDENTDETDENILVAYHNCEDETEVLESYKAVDASGRYNAYIIPVTGGYMIMPGSIINWKYENIKQLSEKLQIDDISDKIELTDKGRLKVSSGFIIQTLEQTSILVNNSEDTSIWQKIRQVIE